jgi:glucosyl-3-phosphoglycerate phosphatase
VPPVLLLLVRHGESTWNAERRMQGVADPALSRAGRAQVEALRPLVAGLAPDAVVGSDLRRARQSAAILAGDGVRTDPRWREADLGAWTARLVDEVVAADGPAHLAWLEHEGMPPGGEPWAATCARVAEAARELAAAGPRRALVVTHGGPIRAACATLAGLRRRFLVPVPTASLTVIDVARGRLRAFGVTPRALPAAPAPD